MYVCVSQARDVVYDKSIKELKVLINALDEVGCKGEVKVAE